MCGHALFLHVCVCVRACMCVCDMREKDFSCFSRFSGWTGLGLISGQNRLGMFSYQRMSR